MPSDVLIIKCDEQKCFLSRLVSTPFRSSAGHDPPPRSQPTRAPGNTPFYIADVRCGLLET